MSETGIRMIATGAKKSDSLFRRKSWHQFEKRYIVYPLKDWSTRDVLGYLNLRKLLVPTKNDKFQTSGVDLTTRDLLRIHDQFPADFERMRAVFPYIGAVVQRREWYGVIE
jgi:3'-phosphoadenosine 5'-phosphosulfate sulfotransferase (PAPS reductase)/FAD synthetase